VGIILLISIGGASRSRRGWPRSRDGRGGTTRRPPRRPGVWGSAAAPRRRGRADCPHLRHSRRPARWSTRRPGKRLGRVSTRRSTPRERVVKDVAADPTIVPKVQSLATQYKDQLATAALLKPDTQAKLAATPTDPATRPRRSPTSRQAGRRRRQGHHARCPVQGPVGHRGRDQPDHPGRAASPTRTTRPRRPRGRRDRQGVQHLGRRGRGPLAGSRRRAAGRPDLLVDQRPAVQDAAAKLTALRRGAAGGPGVHRQVRPRPAGPEGVASLTYLQENAADVQKAVKDAPGQWQRWWWICFAGRSCFLPFIWIWPAVEPGQGEGRRRRHDERSAASWPPWRPRRRARRPDAS